MSALRILSTSVASALTAAQQVSLLLLPDGGQSTARSNARQAIERDDACALDRRRANAALLAAQARHPVLAVRREPAAVLVAARA